MGSVCSRIHAARIVLYFSSLFNNSNCFINSIKEYADNRKNKPNTTYQILDDIIPVHRKIRSIVGGGGEGAMGTSFWERLAKYLIIESIVKR
jgi:hypothetical protein